MKSIHKQFQLKIIFDIPLYKFIKSTPSEIIAEKIFFKILKNTQESTCAKSIFENNIAGWKISSKLTRGYLCKSLVLNKIKFAKFSRKHLFQNLTFDKIQGPLRQYQHQIVDTLAFFYFGAYNKTHTFCTIYAVCHYA